MKYLTTSTVKSIYVQSCPFSQVWLYTLKFIIWVVKTHAGISHQSDFILLKMHSR